MLKKYFDTATEKHTKLPEPNTKGLHTNLHVLIEMNLYKIGVIITLFLPWDPTRTRNHQT